MDRVVAVQRSYQTILSANFCTTMTHYDIHETDAHGFNGSIVELPVLLRR